MSRHIKASFSETKLRLKKLSCTYALCIAKICLRVPFGLESNCVLSEQLKHLRLLKIINIKIHNYMEKLTFKDPAN